MNEDRIGELRAMGAAATPETALELYMEIAAEVAALREVGLQVREKIPADQIAPNATGPQPNTGSAPPPPPPPEPEPEPEPAGPVELPPL